MNILILNNCLYKSAEMLCDAHLSNQIFELAQLLSTNGHGSYKPTYINHPVTVWAGNNLRFCFKYLRILAEEFYKRRGKNHKSYLDTMAYESNLYTDYSDKGDKFPIRNDLAPTKEKYN